MAPDTAAAFIRSLIPAPADSARVVADVYSVSLLILLPAAISIIAAFLLRNKSAASRALVWRAATAVLLLVYVGRYLPLRELAWSVPSAIAEPLVLLGTLQLTLVGVLPPEMNAAGLRTSQSLTVAQVIALCYWAGVAALLVRLFIDMTGTFMRTRRAAQVRHPAWRASVERARNAYGVRRRVQLLVTRERVVPSTWGVLRPVILIPSHALEWSGAHRDALLLHEMSHIRAFDWAFGLAARVSCAAFWFHPAAWYVARRFRAECELATDDSVLGAGVRRSDYAELLADACAAHAGLQLSAAPALGGRAGLRERLRAVLDPAHDITAPARSWIAAAAIGVFVAVLPLSAVRLVPTRAILTTLMEDARWESRAYAVIRLAQRADSLSIAASAAASDPSPEVRAWARYALERNRLPNVPAAPSSDGE